MTDPRDTDRRVAHAMGYYETHYWRMRRHGGDWEQLPFYKTEFGPWTQEMLDWLPRGWRITHTGGTLMRADVQGVKSPHCSSILEAIAKLVIAVAEREEQSHG